MHGNGRAFGVIGEGTAGIVVPKNSCLKSAGFAGVEVDSPMDASKWYTPFRPQEYTFCCPSECHSTLHVCAPHGLSPCFLPLLIRNPTTEPWPLVSLSPCCSSIQSGPGQTEAPSWMLCSFRTANKRSPSSSTSAGSSTISNLSTGLCFHGECLATSRLLSLSSRFVCDFGSGGLGSRSFRRRTSAFSISVYSTCQ